MRRVTLRELAVRGRQMVSALVPLQPGDGGGLLASGLFGVFRVDPAGALGSGASGAAIVPRFTGHGRHVLGLALAAPDAGGARAVSVGRDGFARLWRVQGGEELRRVELGPVGVVPCVAVTEDGRRALLGTSELYREIGTVRGTYLVALAYNFHPRAALVGSLQAPFTAKRDYTIGWSLGVQAFF